VLRSRPKLLRSFFRGSGLPEEREEEVFDGGIVVFERGGLGFGASEHFVKRLGHVNARGVYAAADFGETVEFAV